MTSSREGLERLALHVADFWCFVAHIVVVVLYDVPFALASICLFLAENTHKFHLTGTDTRASCKNVRSVIFRHVLLVSMLRFVMHVVKAI